MIRPPQTVGFFIATKKNLFNFIWATAWFALVYGALLAYELTFDDPLASSISNEPDGHASKQHNYLGMLRWWKQGVSHIMLSGINKADKAVEQEEFDVKSAIAAQSLTVLRESSPSHRPQGANPLDANLVRRVWFSRMVPHYPALDSFYATVSAFLGFNRPTAEAANAQHNPNSFFVRNLADPRSPTQCPSGSFLFVDGSSVGSLQDGSFSLRNRPRSSTRHTNTISRRHLFESFVHCGRKTDTPAEIGRRIEEYFKTCRSVKKATSKQQEDDAAKNSVFVSETVDCVTPGLLTLLLLHRKIMHSHLNHELDHARVAFFDLGAGSEILSTIAVSALHGYRQSERLFRTRKYFKHLNFGVTLPKNNNNNKNSKQKQNSLPFLANDLHFTQTVIPPPAVVIPVEFSPDFHFPTEATKVTSIPSNKKLFSDSTDSPRKDCFGTDPDRVNVLSVGYAIGLEERGDTGSTFSVQRSAWSRTDIPRTRIVNNQKSSSSPHHHHSISKRTVQCFMKQEEKLLGAEGFVVDGVQAEKTPTESAEQKQKDPSFNSDLLEKLEKILKSIDQNNDAHAVPEVAVKRYLVTRAIRRLYNPKSPRAKNLLSRNELNAQSDTFWFGANSPFIFGENIIPHKNNNNNQQEQIAEQFLGQRSRLIVKEQTTKKDQHQHKNQYQSDLGIEQQYVRMHPVTFSRLLHETKGLVKNFELKELDSSRSENKKNTYERKIDKLAAVFFGDVGGVDSPLLDCGPALSQTEMLETVTDSILMLNQNNNNKKNVDHFDLLFTKEDQEQIQNIQSIEGVFMLRPFKTRSKSVNNDNIHKFSWCSACRYDQSFNSAQHDEDATEVFASELIERTISALARAGAVLTSGCAPIHLPPKPENIYGIHETGKEKKEQQQQQQNQQVEESIYFTAIQHPKLATKFIKDTLREFLYHPRREDDDNENTNNEIPASFCAVWISSSPHDQSLDTPLSQELEDMKTDLSERLQDDTEQGKFDDNIKVAIQTGLVESTRDIEGGGFSSSPSSLDDDDDDHGENAALRQIAARHGSVLKSKVIKSADEKSSSPSSFLHAIFGQHDPMMLGLVLLSVLVAFFLIRGICKNFKKAGSAAAAKRV